LGRTEMSKKELGRVEVLARVRSKQLRLVDAHRLMRDRCWPCPVLRPKRYALRAPQGFAPDKANTNTEPNEIEKGDTSNEVREGTFL